MSKEMRIGIITYDSNHLKTEQILLGLISKNKYSLKVYALPFFDRKKREVVFNHRPNQFEATSAREICKAYNIEYCLCNTDCDILNDCDLYLICGAGIISERAIENKKIINIHPGIIPCSRGLDAFKWSIYYSRPIGNTLHFIDANVDMGKIVSIIQTPLFSNDSIESFSRRHYQCEIDMMISFEKYLYEPQNDFENVLIEEATKRMTKENEKEMLEKFCEYKEKYSIDLR